MTPKGEMSGNGSGPAIAHLPPMMKAMFVADAPIVYAAPIVKRRMPAYTGCAQFVSMMDPTPPQPREPFEDPLQRKARLAEERSQINAEKVAAQVELWDPHKPPSPKNGEISHDAYKTLFVARISHDTTVHKLRREFEQFGPIKTLRIVQDDEGQSRGYAFIEYERESDMKEAYKRSDGRKIDGRRVVVDVERGRTVRKWRPRRFGGGLGNTRDPKKKGEKQGPVISGRSIAPTTQSSSSGHYGSGSSSSSYSRRPEERSYDRRERERSGERRSDRDRSDRGDRDRRDRSDRDRSDRDRSDRRRRSRSRSR